MTNLDQLQRFMVGTLRERRALTRNPELTRRAAEYFSGTERLSPVEQLEIYREQFWLRHTSALLEDYPSLAGILGQSDWERLVEEFLSDGAPTSFSLRDLGERLPDFIREQANWLPHQRLSVDMARLEWAYVELFDAPDAERLDPSRLAAISEAGLEKARLVVSPALRLLQFDFPVLELRQRLSSRASEAVKIPEPEPLRVVLYRSGFRFSHEALSVPAYTLFAALAGGASLGAACELACALGTDATNLVNAEVGGWFANWVQQGLIVDVAGA